MGSSQHLSEMLAQVRGWTLQLLDAAPDDALLWAPPGTSNHILWHAGHALWVADVLCVEPLTGATELPAGWADKFGMHCRPVSSTAQWPSRAEIRQLLVDQQNRLTQLVDDYADVLTDMTHEVEGKRLTAGVIHAFHDEARHQGEMYLLLKLARAP